MLWQALASWAMPRPAKQITKKVTTTRNSALLITKKFSNEHGRVPIRDCGDLGVSGVNYLLFRIQLLETVEVFSQEQRGKRDRQEEIERRGEAVNGKVSESREGRREMASRGSSIKYRWQWGWDVANMSVNSYVRGRRGWCTRDDNTTQKTEQLKADSHPNMMSPSS